MAQVLAGEHLVTMQLPIAIIGDLQFLLAAVSMFAVLGGVLHFGIWRVDTAPEDKVAGHDIERPKPPKPPKPKDPRIQGALSLMSDPTDGRLSTTDGHGRLSSSSSAETTAKQTERHAKAEAEAEAEDTAA